jgi:hypothetical protein
VAELRLLIDQLDLVGPTKPLCGGMAWDIEELRRRHDNATGHDDAAVRRARHTRLLHHFSSLVNRDELPPALSASAWAIQFRRHDSLIDNCLANAAIGCSP